MFCTKCGRPLHDGDKFCAYCGTKVREEDRQEAAPSHSRYEEVVFNPPFRAEAERRTRQISDEVSRYSDEPKKETVHFDWNLDGFPSRDSKRRDDFELNWDTVIEKRREPGPVNVEKIIPEEPETRPSQGQAAQQDHNAAPDRKEEPLSIEELEKELFGTKDMEEAEKSATIRYNREDLEREKEKDQFYTYNAKRDAFQELLDREKARVEAIEDQRRSQWESITGAEEVRGPKEPLPFEEVFRETETPLVPPLREVAIVQPPLTAVVQAWEDDKDACGADIKEDISSQATAAAGAYIIDTVTSAASEEEKTTAPFQDEPEPAKPDTSENQLETAGSGMPENEPDAADGNTSGDAPSEGIPSEEPKDDGIQTTKEKTKLRFSVVFPIDAFDGDDDSRSNGGADADNAKAAEKEIDEDEDDDEKSRGGNRVIKTVIIILALIVIIEVIIIGAKTFAPNSGFSMAVDNMMSKITGFFSGQDEEQAAPVSTEVSYLDEYIRAAAGLGENIGNISANPDLKYSDGVAYSFGTADQTQEFTNSPLNGDDTDKTYGQSIVEAVISYFNGWMDTNEDESLIGVNSLEIGEIRSSGDGYYVLTSVTYAAASGDTVSRRETVHLTENNGQITVADVKEETV